MPRANDTSPKRDPHIVQALYAGFWLGLVAGAGLLGLAQIAWRIYAAQ